MVNKIRHLLDPLRVLSIAVWISSLLFGLYILGFYGLALFSSETARWNRVLPGLYHEDRFLSTSSIGAHFIGGGIVLVLGSIQLIKSFRESYPLVHRLLGLIYVFACFIAGIGGLAFILLEGTIGGVVMDIGFGVYGILMMIASLLTGYFGLLGKLVQHGAWAIRLYALAIGSWFYRMCYGFWFLVADGLGHTRSFSGPFDYFMDFFFYLPNLLIAECFLRNGFKREKALSPMLKIVLFILIAYVCLATFVFTKNFWLEGIRLLFS